MMSDRGTPSEFFPTSTRGFCLGKESTTCQKEKKKTKNVTFSRSLWGLLVKDRHTQISATYLVWERSPDGLVKGGAEELTAVFTEADTCDSFTVSSFKPP